MVQVRYEHSGARPEINLEFWRQQMNTIGFTKKTETAFDETIETLSDETLDQVTGGINPQPLPPRDPEPDHFRA
jgi:bacteriocin-like protein